MPDTTYILDSNARFTSLDSMADSSFKNITEKFAEIDAQKFNDSAHSINQKTFLRILPILFLVFIGTYVVIKVVAVLYDSVKEQLEKWLGFKILDDDNNDKSYTEYQPTSQNNYLVYKGDSLGLSNKEVVDILEKYYTYYRNLDKHLQFKFFDRLQEFMNSKQFIIHTHEPFKEMPILICAAAVQISFGLDDYELSHYPYIQIHKEEYFAENSLRVLAGNVQGSCITLAWSQLLKGFSNYEDGSNVGLHEMAHALYFQEILVDKDNESFELHFSELMYRGETVLQQQKCPHNLYTDYAFSNLQEFWAVSVELFFEKANDLNNYYPFVFTTLKDILKQNPIITNQPV